MSINKEKVSSVFYDPERESEKASTILAGTVEIFCSF